jgi:hypothetical protein
MSGAPSAALRKRPAIDTDPRADFFLTDFRLFQRPIEKAPIKGDEWRQGISRG